MTKANKTSKIKNNVIAKHIKAKVNKKLPKTFKCFKCKVKFPFSEVIITPDGDSVCDDCFYEYDQWAELDENGWRQKKHTEEDDISCGKIIGDEHDY